jgi:hypothetical protein
MHTSRRVNISLGLQAGIVFFLTSFWCLAAWIGLHTDSSHLSLFWGAAFFYLPFIAPLFATILLAEHICTWQPNRWWVYSAVLAAASPWIWLFVLIVTS